MFLDLSVETIFAEDCSILDRSVWFSRIIVSERGIISYPWVAGDRKVELCDAFWSRTDYLNSFHQQDLEFNPVFDWKPVHCLPHVARNTKENNCQIDNDSGGTVKDGPKLKDGTTAGPE